MIIQLESATAGNLDAAKRSLEALAHSWGHKVTEASAEARTATETIDDDNKVIDPVSVAALVLSIPSAALAVLDLADRIYKRRRAGELIDHAQQLAAEQVIVCLMFPGRTVELRTMTPDQLLDLADEDPATGADQFAEPTGADWDSTQEGGLLPALTPRSHVRTRLRVGGKHLLPRLASLL